MYFPVCGLFKTASGSRAYAASNDRIISEEWIEVVPVHAMKAYRGVEL
jgi:hypothetical protein